MSKNENGKRNLKTILIVILIMAGVCFFILLLALGILILGFGSAKIEVHDNIAEYQMYRTGENTEKEYRTKWGMDESIWPEAITKSMEVEDYKMVYYNPWDAQFLGYMTIKYNDKAYEAELKRLTDYVSTDYIGNYGVTGFTKHELIAMYADDYQGFVYALSSGKNEITYVEIIFCNYFMDLDYNEYIPVDYLPDGFDATKDNPYRDQYLKKLEQE